MWKIISHSCVRALNGTTDLLLSVHTDENIAWKLNSNSTLYYLQHSLAKVMWKSPIVSENNYLDNLQGLFFRSQEYA